MTKRLISFFLVLCLLAAIPLSARYRYNPYTTKLDYYEAAGDIALGDIGDITLTGLATGNVLYYNGAAWVNLATGANAEVLTLAAGIPSWAAVPAGATTFLALTDTPAVYTGKAGQLVRVNAGANALEFFAGSPAGTVITADGAGGWTKDEALRIVSGNIVFDKLVQGANEIQYNFQNVTFLSTYAGVGEWIGVSIYAPAGKSADVGVFADAQGGAATYVPGLLVSASFSESKTLLESSHPMAVRASNDNDDYIQFQTVGNIPELTSIGGADLKITSDSGAISFNDDTIKTTGEAEVKDITISTPVNVYGLSHNSFADYVANDHIDHTAVSILSAGLITGGGTIDGNQTLTLTEATIEGAIDTLGAVQFTGDVEFLEDIDVTWGDAADRMRIIQGNAAGIEAQALVYIQDDRIGLTANEADEASLHITGEGPDSWAIYSSISKVQWDGDVLWSWANDVDNASITQAAIAGIADVPLINIDDDRTGVTADTVGEATIVMNAAGTYAFYIQTGQAYFAADITQIEDVFMTWADAADHAVIHQSAIAGTADQPLIYIDDDRTGLTANTYGEATLYLDALGIYALTVIDGLAYIGGASGMQVAGYITMFDDRNINIGTNFDINLFWDTNGAADDIYTIQFRAASGAGTNAIFLADLLSPNGMTDHDNYKSPTWAIANKMGADANDYAGVVIGERTQANVLVAHYFDFYAMTGAVDGTPDANATELAAIFRFGASGSATPGYATTPGDVLLEGSLEVDGNQQNAGYNRYDTVYWNDCFDHGTVASKYQFDWDITSLNTQGNGTNTVDTTPSEITLTTDNNAIGDNEGTRTEFAVIQRVRQNRTEWSFDLQQTANTQFYMGWNTSGTNAMVAAADEYVIVFFDVSDNANWQIKVGDGATEDVFTSAIAGAVAHIIHEVWVETDGTVHWRVNGTELDITGSVDNLMTANNHYLIVGQAQSVTGAAVIVVEIDHIENEKTKAH